MEYNSNSRFGAFLTILSNIFAVGLIIFNIYVMIQYRHGNDDLLNLSAILNLFDFFFISAGKGIIFLIPLCIFNIISAKNLWKGICLGLLAENIITYFLGIFYMLIMFIISIIINLKNLNGKKEGRRKYDEFAKEQGYKNFKDWKKEFYRINNMNYKDFHFKDIESEGYFIAQEYGYESFDEMYREELKK